MPQATILVVEDESIIRLLLRDVLRGAGYRVLEAADGRTAIEAYRAGKDQIDLVTLDLQLPDIHGSLVLEELMAIDGEVKVIIATGNVVPDGMVGVCAVLQKPFNLAQLLETVRGVVG